MRIPKALTPETVRKRLQLLRLLPRQVFETHDQVRDLGVQLTETQDQVRDLGVQLNEVTKLLHDLIYDFVGVRITEQRKLLHDATRQAFEARDQVRDLGAKFTEHTKLLHDLKRQVSDLKSETAAQISLWLHDLGQELGYGASLTRLNNVLETTRSELKNLSVHLDTSIHTQLNRIEFHHVDQLINQMHELAAVQFELSAAAHSNRSQWVTQSAERYHKAEAKDFDAYLTQAEHDFPRVFPLWKERLETMEQAFVETKLGNAAHPGDPRSRLFRSLFEIHAFGRALDVGCGVFARPFYLSSYPSELISGLDPLPPIETSDFERVRGLSEYLPWPDESFSTVVSATSLDHCMSLDRSLAEIRRVLSKDGRLLLWIDSVPGSLRYEPDRLDFKPADRFHLFHFDVSWFEEIINKLFVICYRIELWGREFNRVMYVLAKAD
jgi:SAM-dependent methyltransferase